MVPDVLGCHLEVSAFCVPQRAPHPGIRGLEIQGDPQKGYSYSLRVMHIVSVPYTRGG